MRWSMMLPSCMGPARDQLLVVEPNQLVRLNWKRAMNCRLLRHC